MQTAIPAAGGPDPLDQAREVLHSRFGHAAFRAGQESAVRSVLAGRSLLVVMPTGSGKSLLYQLPALMTSGLTLVVSPLIALMKDQVDELVRRGIRATFINSSLSLAEQQERIGRCLRGEAPLLYVAPERFQSAAFLAMVRRVKVSRLAVDEAHCISEWGHDFRPDYRRLRQFRDQMGRPPVTALTATATPRVRKDIIESLGLAPADVDVHVRGFDRPNFTLSVVHARDDDTKIVLVREFLHRNPGCGIIYTGTRRAAGELADALGDVEPNSVVYHAGMEPEARTRAQESFLHGKARLAVATIAFGMGIDKPDIRFVLHYHYPGSVEEYYQQIGRAGRDGLPARCMMLHSPKDRRLREFFIDLSYPTADQVKRVYETLWEIKENPIEMTYAEIARRCGEKIKDGQVASAVRLLDGAGVTRAMAGDAAAAVGLQKPGAEILPHIRGDVQRRAFEALASSLDLEMPGRYAIDLGEMARVAGLSGEQVRRAMAALAEAKHITYEPPFRGRGVEKLVDRPPPFEKVAIDWARQDSLRRLEEEKLEAMEEYIHTSHCRRGFILRYFGEEGEYFRCGMCDCCAPRGGKKRVATATGAAAAATAGASAADAGAADAEELQRLQHEDRREPRDAGTGFVPQRRGGPRRDPQAEIAAAVLVCISNLRFPLGISRTIEILTGSRSKQLLQWNLDRNPAYALLAHKRITVQLAIEKMIEEGYLAQKGGPRPVLTLTARGQEAAKAAKIKAAEESGDLSDTDRTIANAVLVCMKNLKSPLGAGLIVRLLVGSRDSRILEWGLQRNPAYGMIDAPRRQVHAVIEEMIAHDYLRITGDQWRVLVLTERGRAAAETAAISGGAARSNPPPTSAVPPAPPAKSTASISDSADPEPERGDAAPPRNFAARPRGNATAAHADASEALGSLVRQVLTADQEEAKQLVEDLRLFHPREVAARLETWYDATSDLKQQSRAVWLMGELCGDVGLAFLVRRLKEPAANLRRLAASAVGKVVAGLRAAESPRRDAAAWARQVLTAIAQDDPAPQVRQYAAKALAQFMPDA